MYIYTEDDGNWMEAQRAARECLRDINDKIQKARTEVAREIFEEIEKVIGEQYENYVFDNLEIEGVQQDAIIAFADVMKCRFAELKKKYTEEKE